MQLQSEKQFGDTNFADAQCLLKVSLRYPPLFVLAFEEHSILFDYLIEL